MLNWLKSRFAGPRPAGPPQVLRAFPPNQPTITQSGIRVEHGAWHIDASAEQQTIRLFEVENPAVEQCLLTYRAELRAEALQGRAFLEMWCRLPGRGEFFSKGHEQAVSGTVEWARYEIPFYLKGDQKPDLIKLNVVVEGPGTVWVGNVELLKTPLASGGRRARLPTNSDGPALCELGRTPLWRSSQNAQQTKFAEFTFHALG